MEQSNLADLVTENIDEPMIHKSLAEAFWQTAELHGERPALEVQGAVLTYRQLRERAAAFAAALINAPSPNEPKLTAVFAYRSVTAYAGVLAALFRGHGYVPLNRTFPADRTRTMLQRSGCHSLIVDEGSATQLDLVLTGLERKLVILLPDNAIADELARKYPQHLFLGPADLASPVSFTPLDSDPDQIAYVLFTSGSTGTPKGVMVSQRNLRHHLNFVCEHLEIRPEDRFSQTFDMTFDLSAGDMFMAWEHGACVCCPSQKALLNPANFIRDSKLTIWHSVPSMPVFMKRLGSLKPNAFPFLRLSMFAGEALPVDVVRAWTEAAPYSRVENMYGPTEATITCTNYRWNPDTTPSEALHGVVPIGWPYPGMQYLVVDESLQEVPPGTDGELLMAGPQLALGYLNDPDKTAAAFLRPPGHNIMYYRTGDRVRRPIDGGPLCYLGRMDNQVKILGHRVELGEIEAVVREESSVDGVVALGWPPLVGGAGGVEVFLQTENPGIDNLKERVASRLPVYMTPRRFHYLRSFPLNSNGKYDRLALSNLLEKLK